MARIRTFLPWMRHSTRQADVALLELVNVCPLEETLGRV